MKIFSQEPISGSFVNQVQFQSNQLLVFDGETSKERRFVPWEVKEATIKNSLGLLGIYMTDILFPLGQGFSLGMLFFGLNYTRTVY